MNVKIIGSGHTRFGRLESYSLEDLIVEAGREAIADAAIEPKDIDALFLGHFNSGMVSDAFASSLMHQISPELRFKPATRVENACASGSAAVSAGIAAIRSRQARVTLVIGAEKMTSKTTSEATKALAGAGYQNVPNEACLSFPQLFAIAAEEYQLRYQDPLPAMAQIASKNHENAERNPLAHMRRKITLSKCNTVSETNPRIAPPLRLTDCSLISDGAAAIILVSEEHAHSFSKKVIIRSMVHVSDLLPLSKRDFPSFEGPELAMRESFARARINVADLSFAEVHDCFTIAELLIYEAMGLAPKGQGFRALEDGIVFRDGALPVNLSGGLKAKGHPVGATGVSMHAMAFRQLTDEAGDIQLPGANLGLVFNMGGAAVANYASVLEAEKN